MKKKIKKPVVKKNDRQGKDTASGALTKPAKKMVDSKDPDHVTDGDFHHVHPFRQS